VADEDLQRQTTFTYFVGATQKFWEEVRNPRTRAPITATSVTARLLNRDANTSVPITETIRISSGLVEVTLANTYMTAPGQYQIEWTITYTDGLDTPIIIINTDIISKYRDATYLMSLVPRMRVWIDDDPEDESKRIKSDIKLKPYIEMAVRHKMDDYSLAADADGNMEIDTEPAAESDDEKLIVLWAGWFFYRYGYTAIAGERTRMFSISYSEAYAQMRDRLEAIMDSIVELDATQAMYFASETSMEFYGQISRRTNEAITTWNAE
jgi:hypothetical protein